MNTERKLYQWDTGQKLVGCTGLYVDFPIGTEVYRVETTDGMCIIPDELLQTSGGHKVYECMTNNTIRSFAFSVTPRPQPPDYVFTPTERLTFEGLVQKVDDVVADMIRRADSGEFDGYTPVKGKDYFTTAEIQQIQNEVSSGAIEEFKTVVDTETETFDNNAETKLIAYNQNDSEKTASYNANATKKLNAYNTNANNRLAEFDAHTEQIQTDVSELKSDLAKIATIERANLIYDITPTEYEYIDGSGNRVANEGFFTYENIPVDGITKIYANTNGAVTKFGRSIVFFDINNSFISFVTMNLDKATNGVSVPSNAKYAYYSLAYDDWDTKAKPSVIYVSINQDVEDTVTLNENVSVDYNQLKNTPSTPSAQSIRKPTFSFIFDDGTDGDIAAKSLFDTYGFKCGFALVANRDDYSRYLQYQNEGFEILSHSINGTPFENVTDVATADNYLKTSKETLETNGLKITGWVTPSSSMLRSQFASLCKYYEYGFGWVTDMPSHPEGYHLFSGWDIRQLSRCPLQSLESSEIIQIIDNTIANNGYLIMYGHSYPNTKGESVEGMKDILDYLATKVDNDEIIVDIPRNAINHYYTMRHSDYLALLNN